MDDATGVSPNGQQAKRWNREEIAEILSASGDDADSAGPFPIGGKAPRSTLQYWQKRQLACGLGLAAAKFFDTPEGLQLLERIVAAVHVVFSLANLTGIRGIRRFLELSGLDEVVGSGYGTQQRLAKAIEAAIVDYGNQEQQRLAAQMPAKKATLCADETFHHGQICLVAIDAASNFIVLETYAESRDAKTWTASLKTSMDGLAQVEVIQVTSDQAGGLLSMARENLGAHQSPDLFHCQQEARKGLSLALESQIAAAQKELDKAIEHTARVESDRQEALAHPRPGRPRDFAEELALAKAVENAIDAKLQDCCNRQVRADEALKGLGDDYHAFERETGQAVDARTMHNRLRRRFDVLDRIAEQARLSERCREHLAKARRLLPVMVGTVLWVMATIRRWVEELDLPAAVERQVLEQLIPGLYLERVAAKTADRDERRRLLALSQRLMARARAPNQPLARLSPEDRQAVERTARQAADLFQRSSSCVEGRNGFLSLLHHHAHQLRPERLKALTVLHNYFSRRADQTTAAERFFEAKPRDLFGYILERLGSLPRPHAKRPTQPLNGAA